MRGLFVLSPPCQGGDEEEVGFSLLLRNTRYLKHPEWLVCDEDGKPMPLSEQDAVHYERWKNGLETAGGEVEAFARRPEGVIA